MKTEQEQQEILSELENNNGTQQYHKIPFSNVVYTDGINNLIEKCKCWWLFSDLGIEISNKTELQKPFLVVSLKVNEDSTAELILKEDTDLKPIYTKKYNFTDFPLSNYEFYYIDKVFLLKSEY